MTDQNKHEESNIHLLRYLEKKQEVSQRDMAKHLGISLGKVNFILKALLQKRDNKKLVTLKIIKISLLMHIT